MNRKSSKNDEQAAPAISGRSPVKKVRVGVIGAGGISQVAHIPNLLASPGAELVALCDSDPRRASMVAERFNVAVWFDEPDAMFRHTNLDAVIITTPTITHPALCRLALENNVDVLLEKPFARNVEEARAIIDSVERTGRILMVAMNSRFRPDVVQLRRVIQRGELGNITMVRAGWLRRLGVWGRPYWFTDPKLAGGGVLMDLGTQMIDLILFLLGFPTPVDVAVGTSYKSLELDVEDLAAAFVRLADDIPFLIEVSWANCDDHDKAYIWISGTHGVATLNPLRITRRQINSTTKVKLPSLGGEVKLYQNSFRSELEHFLNCVRTRQTPLSNAQEALKVVEIVSRLYQSADR